MPMENRIAGPRIAMSGGRHVFHAERSGYHYLRFRNNDVEETQSKTSDDAADTLIQLLTAPREAAKWILRCADGERDAITWERMK